MKKMDKLRQLKLKGAYINGLAHHFKKEKCFCKEFFEIEKKNLQKTLGQERKVFIAYPATLKYLDEIANEKILRDEEFKKMKSEMDKIYTVEPPCATTSRKRPSPMQ